MDINLSSSHNELSTKTYSIRCLGRAICFDISKLLLNNGIFFIACESFSYFSIFVMYSFRFYSIRCVIAMLCKWFIQNVVGVM